MNGNDHDLQLVAALYDATFNDVVRMRTAKAAKEVDAFINEASLPISSCILSLLSLAQYYLSHLSGLAALRF